MQHFKKKGLNDLAQLLEVEKEQVSEIGSSAVLPTAPGVGVWIKVKGTRAAKIVREGTSIYDEKYYALDREIGFGIKTVFKNEFKQKYEICSEEEGELIEKQYKSLIERNKYASIKHSGYFGSGGLVRERNFGVSSDSQEESPFKADTGFMAGED